MHFADQRVPYQARTVWLAPSMMLARTVFAFAKSALADEGDSGELPARSITGPLIALPLRASSNKPSTWCTKCVCKVGCAGTAELQK